MLSLHSFAIDYGGLVASLEIKAGESLAVVGPAASGKSRFLSALIGHEQPARGQARINGTCSIAGRLASRRSRPQTLAQQGRGSEKAAHASEALSAAGLWECRQTPLAELSPAQLSACE